ncbi:hypothetical protein EJ04DRAFT_487240 [Polyplosphaeria fusca]|uniref:DNA 3'-5' helicase n=1 Tax=Polyplosphaeria fusca TaxID=682080 RepID=A0A9P4V313_9PLEO|nr:hypothetical protein EJ04DRAFT_487240 [Polyplosphaeria fusca]
MPKNNLKEHLNWLLTERPFIAPATSFAGYDPHAVPSSPATLSQNHSFLIASTSNNEPPPANTQPSLSTSRPEQGQINTEGLPDIQGAEHMARLRATPGDGKPQLMLARTPGLNSSSEYPRAENRNAKDGGSDRTTRAQPNTTPGSASRSIRNPKQRVVYENVESIDLTQDKVGHGSPTRMPTKKGRKRKSEEYEGNAPLRKSPRPVRTVPPGSAKTDTDRFVNIEAVFDTPQSPPPPYSTAVLDIHEDDLGYNAVDDDSLMVLDSPPLSRPKRQKQKSPSRTPSEASIPLQKTERPAKNTPSLRINHSNWTGHQRENILSPAHRKGRSRAEVQDSEQDADDDEFDGFSDIEAPTEPTKSTTLLSQHRVTASPEISRSQRSAKHIRMSPVPDEHELLARNLEQKLSTPRPQANLVHRPSPRKVQTTPQPTPSERATLPPPSELSREQRAFIGEVVKEFLKAESYRLQNHLTSATKDLDKIKAAFVSHSEEFGFNPSEHAKLTKASAKRKAVEQLVKLSTDHESLSAKRQAITKKIHDDIKYGTLDAADSDALNTAFKALEEVQHHVYSLLSSAGMHAYLKPIPGLNSGEDHDGVIVQSTQAPIARKSKEPLHQESVPQTQYVKQTQISVHETWTPSRNIRFANEALNASPPPPPRLNTTLATTRGAQSKTTGPKDEPRPHRILETPQHHRTSPAQKRSAAPLHPSDYESFHMRNDMGDDFDEDESLFTNHMGTPPQLFVDEEDFCDDDDDDFMAEVGNIENRDPFAYDWKSDRAPTRAHDRDIFRETTTNTTNRVSSSPRKSQRIVGMSHPWSDEVGKVLVKQFRLRGFRPGQLEAINTTLSGKHCFVLMPTGGGKSLCYQLPSVITSGKTRGVTIVVSPLLSLMEDQVEACRQRFKMQAYLINGESTKAERDFIIEGLQEPDPQKFIQLLYVTPEMLSMNQRMISVLQEMHRKRRLARVVIDEAHCVSQWGHDFRPDYKALGDVMRQFTGVPIIALTATATQLVRSDVVANLGIEGCQQFSQSFNRPNLSYTVLSKRKGVVKSIAELINEKHKAACGIVYCLARKSCEKVAEQLCDFGIQAHHYHAGMKPAERSKVQSEWQNNTYKVIVATIAFGMGIDKPDVRFVIHHSLPKSLEGYYQETGRAGRDGKPSQCYLYYLYTDSKVLRQMIDKGDGNHEQKQRQYDMLRTMVQYCENKNDCRRFQVLKYFGESFNSASCNRTCDNCVSGVRYEEKDVTELAKNALLLVQQVENQNATKHQCMDAFRGAKGAKTKWKDVTTFGHGGNLERGDVERLFHALMDQNALHEETVKNNAGFMINYLHLGKRSGEYLYKGKTLRLQVRHNAITVVAKKVAKERVKATSGRAEYPSTNISSPTQPARKRDLRQYTYEEDDNDSDDDYYEPVQNDKISRKRTTYERVGFVVDNDDDARDGFNPVLVGATTKRSGRRDLGKPITVDERMATLNDFQKMVLEDFMRGAKTMTRAIMVDKGLRKPPFTDTILREMGIRVPKNKEELLAIPGVNPNMVDLYDHRFMPLIQNTRAAYGNNHPMSKHQQSRGRAGEAYEDHKEEDYDNDDDDDDAMPLDPNHRINVIDLCSSPAPEDIHSPNVEFEEDEEDSFAVEDDNSNEQSSYFAPQRVDPRVEEYQRRGSHLAAQRQSVAPSKAPTAFPDSRVLPWKSKSKRRSSGSFGASHAGVTKKKYHKKTTAGSGSGGFRTKKSAGGGGRGRGGDSGGWSSILAMPT